MTVYVTVDDDDARRKVERLADSLTPTVFSNFFRGDIDGYFQNRMRERFESEGDEAVGKWAKLEDATVSSKARKGLLDYVNRATGEMRDFLVSGTFDAESRSGDVEFVYPRETPSPDVDLRINIAEEGRKGRIQREKGRFAGRSKGQPARPVLGASMDDLDYITDALYRSIERYTQ